MSKIIINSRVFSKNEEETLSNIFAIKKDEKITYNYKNTSVNIIMLQNKVFITRENNDMMLNLEFEKNKTLVSAYLIKDLNIEVKVETKTKKLMIDSNSIVVEYDLFMNGEYSDSFIYNLEWRDL